MCEPLLVHAEEAETRPQDALGSGFVMGVLTGAVVLAAGAVTLVWSTDLGAGLLVLGAAMPLLVLQDLGRYLGIARHQPGRALVLDTVWLVLMVVAVVLVFLLDAMSLPWFIAAWAGAGAVAGLVTLGQYRGCGWRPGIAWLRETWPYSWRYLLSFSATQGSALAGSIGVGAIAGARALGAIRGALLLVRPFMTLQIASIASGVTEITRMRADTGAVRRYARRTSLLATTVAAGNALVLLVLPDVLGRAVLADTWEATKPLLAPAGVNICLLGVLSGARAALLGLREVRTTVRIDLAATVVGLVAMVSGAVVDGAVGAWWGVAAGQGVNAVVWWACLAGVLRRRAGGAGEPEPTDSAAVDALARGAGEPIPGTGPEQVADAPTIGPVR